MEGVRGYGREKGSQNKLLYNRKASSRKIRTRRSLKNKGLNSSTTHLLKKKKAGLLKK